MEDLVIMGKMMFELMLNDSIEKYKANPENKDNLIEPLVASFSPAQLKLLKLAVEDLTDSRKDYHIVMKFVEKIEKLVELKVNEINNELNPIKIVEE